MSTSDNEVSEVFSRPQKPINEEITDLKNSATELLLVCSLPVLVFKDKEIVEKAKQENILSVIVPLTKEIEENTKNHHKRLQSLSKKHDKWNKAPKTSDQYLNQFTLGTKFLELSSDICEKTAPKTLELIDHLEKITDHEIKDKLQAAKTTLQVNTTSEENVNE